MLFSPLDPKRFTRAKEYLLSDQLRDYQYEFLLNLHGVHIVLRFNEFSLLEKLKAYFPKSWTLTEVKDPLVVYWKNSFEESFWESENPDCQIEHHQAGEIALQRDFAAFFKKDRSIDLHTRFHLDDGFYNFLRWLMPRMWIHSERLLLHSSCVIDEHRKAHICLGVSGAGKSTIASMAPDSWTVLGDDMNIIRFKAGKLYACASAVGQAMESLSDFGKEFEIAAFYGLEQSKENILTKLGKVRCYTKLASSCANLFWDSLSRVEVSRIQKLLLNACEQSEYYNLQFNKDGKVWDYVDRNRKNI